MKREAEQPAEGAISPPEPTQPHRQESWAEKVARAKEAREVAREFRKGKPAGLSNRRSTRQSE
jgi:hypothetical protein